MDEDCENPFTYCVGPVEADDESFYYEDDYYDHLDYEDEEDEEDEEDHWTEWFDESEAEWA